MEFEAEVLVLYHSTTIAERYQAMIHCGCVRQAGKILGMDKDFIRTGDRALVHFKFMQNPEYVKEGMRLVFREGMRNSFITKVEGHSQQQMAGRTKGIGKVARIIC